LKLYDYQWKVAKFDLTLTATETPEHLSFSFEYSTRLFKPKTIDRFTGYFKSILAGVLQSPGLGISQIELISPGEKQQLLYGFNDTAEEIPFDKTVHQMVEDQTEKTPDNIALIFKDRALTYRQLNQRADRLAGVLMERGLRHEMLAALMVERSIEMVIGILGILKAGGAYLPIDPDYPEERIRFMLEDSSKKIIVTDGLMVKKTNTKPSDADELPNRQTYKPTNRQTNLAYI
ncbi:MAG: AMP-binding protein, partial [bacterium]|nr:AMP-binding protein [bacterium]